MRTGERNTAAPRCHCQAVSPGPGAPDKKGGGALSLCNAAKSGRSQGWVMGFGEDAVRMSVAGFMDWGKFPWRSSLSTGNKGNKCRNRKQNHRVWEERLCRALAPLPQATLDKFSLVERGDNTNHKIQCNKRDMENMMQLNRRTGRASQQSIHCISEIARGNKLPLCGMLYNLSWLKDKKHSNRCGNRCREQHPCLPQGCSPAQQPGAGDECCVQAELNMPWLLV